MKKYIYTGDQPCHLTIIVDKQPVSISMYKGEQYELPSENAKVVRYEAAGILKSVSPTTKTKL